MTVKLTTISFSPIALISFVVYSTVVVLSVSTFFSCITTILEGVVCAGMLLVEIP